MGLTQQILPKINEHDGQEKSDLATKNIPTSKGNTELNGTVRSDLRNEKSNGPIDTQYSGFIKPVPVELIEDLQTVPLTGVQKTDIIF